MKTSVKKSRSKPATPPLAVTKLGMFEEQGLQAMLQRLADVDQKFGRDMVVQGALPDHAEPWARLHTFVEGEVPNETIGALEDSIYLAYADRLQYAYLGGIAVGLRLARQDAPLSVSMKGGAK